MDELRFNFGIRIPEDVLMAGFDGIPEAGRLKYRLTTVQQPIRDMVLETLRMLGIEDPSGAIASGDDRPLAGHFVSRDTIVKAEA